MNPAVNSFTITANYLRRELVSACSISAAWDPKGGLPQTPLHEFQALWDTGATGSVITQTVVEACSLTQTGLIKVGGVHGEQNVPTYQVNIVLPNNVGFPNVQVTMGQFTGADILIGMDIITRGDFTVTNSGGETKFSFRHPPQEHIDFVKQVQSMQASPNKQNRAERRRGQKQQTSR